MFEKENVVGGNRIAAAAMELKSDMEACLDYITQKVMTSGADIRLSTAATPNAIRALAPDALVIAVGAAPFMPDVPGSDLGHVRWAADADMGKVAVGENVILVGGGALGIESAVTQTARGKKVTVLELLPMLAENGVSILTGRQLTAVYPDAAECTVLETGETERHACDTVLISAGLVPRKTVVEELRHLLPETEIHIVGDVRKPATLGEAIRDGFNAALNT